MDLPTPESNLSLDKQGDTLGSQVTPPNTSASPPRPSARRPMSDTNAGRSERIIRHRSRTGCLTCRARKIKCDETQPQCQNCKRCILDCTWPIVTDVVSSRVRQRLQRQQAWQQDVRSTVRGTAPATSASSTSTATSEGNQTTTITVCELQTATITTEQAPLPTTPPTESVHRDREQGSRKEVNHPSQVLLPLTACINCRIARCHCSVERPSCARCRQFGLACTYATAVIEKSTDDMETTPSLSSPGTSELLLEQDGTTGNGRPGQLLDAASLDINQVPKPVILQHIHAFFRDVYPCQANGFLHRGTLLRLFHTGRINRKVLLAICAVASRFVPLDGKIDKKATRNTAPGQAEAWAKEAKTLLALEDLTLDTVITALLLARHDIHNGHFGSAWILSSTATRAALALGLNREHNHASVFENGPEQREPLSFTEQETRRRLFWACYCLDRMMSTGQSDLIMLRPEQIVLQLPCEEHHYLYGTPCWTPVPRLEWTKNDGDDDDDIAQETEAEDGPNHSNICRGTATGLLPYVQLQAEGDIGLFGHYVQIMEMRYCILHYVRNRHKSATRGQSAQPRGSRHNREHPPPPWSPTSWFARCKRKLTRWKQVLPPQFQLVPETIYVRHAQHQLSSLAMLHVWYDQCMSDLCRIAMPGFPESLPDNRLRLAPPGWVEQQRQACVFHSSNIVRTLKTITDIGDSDEDSSNSNGYDSYSGKDNVPSNSGDDARNECHGQRRPSNNNGKRRFVFLDASLPMCVFDSIRLQLQWLFMQPPAMDPQTTQNRKAECQARCETLMGFVEDMALYFRQAEWLLDEIRRMLQRHGIPVRNVPATYSSSTSPDASGHPWQRRIQQLQENEVYQSPGGEAVITTNTNDPTGDVGLSSNLTPSLATFTVTNTTPTSEAQVCPDMGSGNASSMQPQQMGHGFLGNGGGHFGGGSGLYKDSMAATPIPFFGWDELQVLPDLSGLTGPAGNWLANGAYENLDACIPDGV